MRVCWTGPALADLRSHTDYIAQDSPAAAEKVAERTLEAASLLERFPSAGRLHAESGARILAVRRTSLLLIYDVDATEVRLLHVRHMAQLPYGEGD